LMLNPQQVSRRKFLARGSSVGAWQVLRSLAGTRSLFAQQPGDPSQRVLHIIGYSHIDAAWLWPWRDGSNLALSTMRSALDRMTETPGFHYSHSSSIHYRWLQAASPSMFAEVKRRIAEGRWEVVGGWPVEPDCNIPSTESFVRHALYGKQYCEQELGARVDIGFNHAAGLPTILKHAGYNSYVFMRPREMEADLPRLFWWEGPDGSRVLTWHVYYGYDRSASDIAPSLDHLFQPGVEHGAFLLGVGDHGGAVTKAQIAQIEAMRSKPGIPELRWSTVGEFLNAVRTSPAVAGLPVVRGGLQHHARGCYSACGEVKLQNRRAERLLAQSESISALASVVLSRPSSQEGFADGWWRVLFNQFHDILAGSAFYADYEAARDGQGLACELAMERKIEALEALAKVVNLSDEVEGAVFAFNPLPWKRKAWLQYIPEGYGSKNGITHLRAPDGSVVQVQKRPSPSMTDFFPQIATWVELPAFGYRVYTCELGGPATSQLADFPSHADISHASMGIRSLRSPEGTEILAQPIGLVIIEDKSDTWAHDVSAFRKELGHPEFVAAEVAESGPICRVTRQHLRWQNSTITLDITEYAGEGFLDLYFVIDWQEHEQILMLELPTALQSARCFAKVAGAVAERPTTGEEEPYQDWVAVQGVVADHIHTVALLNAQTYSYNCLDGLLRTVLIRSAPYARHVPNPVTDNGINAWLDQGRQERRFRLLRATGSALETNLDRLAEEFQTPAEYVIDSRHSGSLPREQSFLELSPPNISLLALKVAEIGDAVVIRVQERAGLATNAHLRCNRLQVEQSFSIGPWEMKTIRLERKRPSNQALKMVSALEV